MREHERPGAGGGTRGHEKPGHKRGCDREGMWVHGGVSRGQVQESGHKKARAAEAREGMRGRGTRWV